MERLQAALTELRSKAFELREVFGDEARARSIEWAAETIEAAIRLEYEEVLSLRSASRRSGYSIDHLSRLLRSGKIPNHGRWGAPLIRAADLPIRATRRVVPPDPSGYDPVADARTLSSRQGGR